MSKKAYDTIIAKADGASDSTKSMFKSFYLYLILCKILVEVK